MIELLTEATGIMLNHITLSHIVQVEWISDLFQRHHFLYGIHNSFLFVDKTGSHRTETPCSNLLLLALPNIRPKGFTFVVINTGP